MKKIFASVFALMLVVATGLGLSACSYKQKPGTYKVTSIYAMGLTATQKSFEKYAENRSVDDIKYNALYQPIAMIMNLKIKINKDGKTGVATFKNYESILSSNNHFDNAVASAKEKKLINKKGDLVVDVVCVVAEDKEKDTYNIVPVVNGEKTTWNNIWNDSTPFADPMIYCRIKDGQIAFELKVSVYEESGAPAGVALTTTVTVHMKKDI